MIIANPLYDVVFKYLLEDMEIARELLSTILGEPILYLEVKPQETVTENSPSNLNVLRFDFKATIETRTGELKKVLIELQKLKQSFDIMRFRRYLGDNYKKEDDVIIEDGSIMKMPLPIVTIYILGFPLTKLTNAITKINREYIDVLANKTIEIQDDFVELLTHDSYIIQVLALPPDTKTKLERVLQIFNPKFKTKDKHTLDFTGNTEEPIVEKMVSRLQRAISDEEMRHIMDVEDEIERAFARVMSEKDLIIAEKDQALAEKEQVINEKERALEAERQKVESLMRQLAELQKQDKK
jgi:hypothetical protein